MAFFTSLPAFLGSKFHDFLDTNIFGAISIMFWSFAENTSNRKAVRTNAFAMEYIVRVEKC